MVKQLLRSRGRYGTLRPHHPQILEWCVEGIEFSLMVARLEELGAFVSISSLWSHCDRRGWLLINPYSSHYDSVVAYKFSQGGLNAEDLPTKRKQHSC